MIGVGSVMKSLEKKGNEMNCWRCGEINAVDFGDGRHCWECGADLVQVAVPRQEKTEADRMAEKEAEGEKKAQEIFPLLVAKIGKVDKFEMHEIITDTCKKHKIFFAMAFMKMVMADERFNEATKFFKEPQRRGIF